MNNNQWQGTTVLIVGLIGIIIILLFAIATGYGKTEQPVVPNENCQPKKPTIIDIYKKKSKKTPDTLVQISPAGLCPPNYTNFTNSAGNTLCCANQNIDLYAHKCPSLGPKGICSMAPGTEDDRILSDEKKYYPLCQTVFGQSPVTLYQNCDRTGWSINLPGVGDYQSSLGHYPSNASYIVVPSGVKATIFTGIFNGKSKVIDQNQSFNFCDDGAWAKNKILSIRIDKASSQLPVTLYQHCDKGGWSVIFSGVGDYQAANRDFPYDASYIEVPAGLRATIYTGIFNGQSKTIDQNKSFNFCDEGLWANDSIRSIRIVRAIGEINNKCITPGNNVFITCKFGASGCWTQYGGRFYGNVSDPNSTTQWIWATPNAFNGAQSGIWYNFYTTYNNNTGKSRNVFINAAIDNNGMLFINDTNVYSQPCSDFCGQVSYVLPMGISHIRMKAINHHENSPAGFWVIITDASTGQMLVNTNSSWTFTVGESPSHINCLEESARQSSPISSQTPGGNVFIMGEIGRGSPWDNSSSYWNANAPVGMGVMWIWGSPGLGGNLRKQNTRIPYKFYKNYYNLGDSPRIVNVNASADDYGLLFINDVNVYGRTFSNYAGQANITLPIGWSKIVFTAENGYLGQGGDNPGEAGVWLTLTDAKTNELLLKTDSTWTCEQGSSHLF